MDGSSKLGLVTAQSRIGRLMDQTEELPILREGLRQVLLDILMVRMHEEPSDAGVRAAYFYWDELYAMTDVVAWGQKVLFTEQWDPFPACKYSETAVLNTLCSRYGMAYPVKSALPSLVEEA